MSRGASTNTWTAASAPHTRLANVPKGLRGQDVHCCDFCGFRTKNCGHECIVQRAVAGEDLREVAWAHDAREPASPLGRPLLVASFLEFCDRELNHHLQKGLFDELVGGAEARADGDESPDTLGHGVPQEQDGRPHGERQNAVQKCAKSRERRTRKE